MSDYTIEISGNQPYYIEVDNSTLQEVINLAIDRDSDINVGVSTSNTFVTFETPSGYPIASTSGDLSYVRVSGLSDYVSQAVSDSSYAHILQYHTVPVGPPNIDGGTP